MDNMAAYYQPPPPPPTPGIHSSHYPHYHSPLPPPQPPLRPPPSEALHHPHHLPPPPFHHPPPLPLPSYSSPSHSFYDEVRTVFVAGLPEDVKPREIYNLFREFPGYESSNLRPATKNCQPFGFAVFSDQQSAVAAIHALNGMVFDLEKGSTLYIDLAKSNSRSKRQRADEDATHSDKKFKGSPAFLRGVGSFHIPGMDNSAFDTIGYSSAQSSVSYDGRGINDTNAPKFNNTSASHAPQNNPPCPTIFVANVGPHCTEEELNQVFSRCRGFLKLKIQSTYGPPVAFVDFQDTACSTEALTRLQGTVLPSSPTGEGLRLEYAKSRMGMRRKSK